MLKLTTNKILLILWGVVLLFLTRQVPLGVCGVVGNLALFVFFVVIVSRLGAQSLRAVFLMGLGLFLLAAYSMMLGNSLSGVGRFFFVVYFVLLAYFVDLPAKQTIKLLFIFTAIQVFAIIVMEFICAFVLNEALQKGVRFFSLAQGWGDIYPSGLGPLFKIQIKGTAILPFVYFLSWIVPVFPKKRIVFWRALYLIAVFFAGNFAYILGLLAFHTVWYFMGANNLRVLRNRVVIGVGVLLLSTVPFYGYLSATMEAKSAESNAIRIEQAEVILADMQQNVGTMLLGKGLGNSVEGDGYFRSYEGAQYFELQTLYIFNQLGFVFFGLFSLLNVWLTRRRIVYPALWLVYGCYVLYAVTNPYMIDTTQVVVIVSLIAAKNLMKDDEDRLRAGALQS